MTTGRVPAVEGKGAADDNAPAAIGREVFTDGSYAEIFRPDSGRDPFRDLYGQKRDDVLACLSRMPADSEILDLGGGMGRIAIPLADRHRVTLCDISERMLAMAGASAREAGVAADRLGLRQIDAGEPLPFPAASFDAAIALDLLVHLPDPVAALRELRRVLRPQGQLLADMTNANPLWTLRYPGYVGRRPRRWLTTLRGGGVLPEWQSIVRHRRRGEFERMLGAAGFTVSRRWRYGPSICPKWFLDLCTPISSTGFASPPA
jgi:ubiquinone/menaquinone biosynthesis C-methylase UbiE